MNGKVLADTNVLIALFAGDPGVMDRLRQQHEVFLCVPVLGELRYGALASIRVEQNLARLDDLARELVVLDCDRGTAAAYAVVKNRLRGKGTPIPENDVWIAALAQQHGLTLATRDSHFEAVEGLSLELW
ncbi:MAG: type II toxin-antitoxin system VapC family toxin [Candidatus Korobacteraceae bacterium]|jgi:tRNA(fMet)-specific endonuclease VapC